MHVDWTLKWFAGVSLLNPVAIWYTRCINPMHFFDWYAVMRFMPSVRSGNS